MEDKFKEQISEHMIKINKELHELTKLLEEAKKESDFIYKIDIKYSDLFEYWKCNLVLEHTTKF